MSMKNPNVTVRNRTHDLPVCILNQLRLCLPLNIARDLDYLQYTFSFPSVALSNVSKICQVTSHSSLGNKSVERINQVLRLSLNTTVEV
jgi:hypothetical protein